MASTKRKVDVFNLVPIQTKYGRWFAEWRDDKIYLIKQYTVYEPNSNKHVFPYVPKYNYRVYGYMLDLDRFVFANKLKMSGSKTYEPAIKLIDFEKKTWIATNGDRVRPRETLYGEDMHSFFEYCRLHYATKILLGSEP